MKNDHAGGKDMLPAIGSSSDWEKHFDDRLNETECHNKRMERAARRQATANFWDAKKHELEYKVALYKHYTELKESGMMNDEQILKFFPDMHAYIQK